MKYPFKGEWQLNTLDIVIAVVIGVIEAALEITGAIGFIERMFFVAGTLGWVLYGAYNGITTVLFCTLGWLRRRAGTIVLAAAVLGLVRWFFGDPDGPILLWYWIGAALPGALAMWLLGWKDNWSTYFIGNGVITAMSILVTFPILGIEMAGGPFGAFLATLSGFIFGGIWGLLAKVIGTALARVGISRASREWELEEPEEATVAG